MKWCEHCRDHFEVDHYDDEGYHRAGFEFGPTGSDHIARDIVRDLAAASIAGTMKIEQLAALKDRAREWVKANGA